MNKLDFNENWYYGHVDGEDRTLVSIPHDAMLLEKRLPESKGGINIAWFEGRDYWYEKELEWQEEFSNSTVILEFEGVYHNAEVYLNEEKVAYRPYGYSNFYADLTGKIKKGKNAIKVFAKNSDQPNSRWYSGAGIYRPVSLYILPEKHIDINGVKIQTTDFKNGEISINVKTNAKGIAKVGIYDYERIVLEHEAYIDGNADIVLRIPNAKLWSPESPNLYKCKVVFDDDERTVSFGIREIKTDAKSGFQINGERVVLKGACIHHDNGILGACAYSCAEKRKVKILKNAGYNAIRSAHNPCSKALLDACDELGMLVMDELVDCWYIHKTKYDYVNIFDKWWKKDIKSMVEKDYNHPSVVMYSTGNEVSETAQEKGIALTREMTEYLHSLDDTRSVTCGVNIFFNFLSSIGFGVYSDDKAEKEVKSAEKGGKKKAVGSEFFNQLAGILGDKTMKLGATLRGCDKKTREAFANMDIAGYNYGILRYKKDVKRYPDRVILGSETFCSDAHAFIEMSRKHPSVIGDFVWAGMDYLGEVAIGSQEYKDYAKDFTPSVGWISAGSGRIDITGRELAEAAYTKVAFGLEKIKIASVPADNFKNAHSPSAWKMTNARLSWSWNGFDGNTTRVEVYTKAHSVSLYINGINVGKKRCGKNLVTTFEVKYYSGEIKAVALDASGKEIASEILKTAGEDTVLKAFPEEREIKKDELAYVRFKYTDKNSILKPLARGKIELNVEGGNLLGFGHACPYNEDGYLNDFSDTYYGEALAIIKPESKKIILKAKSPYGGVDTVIDVK